MELNHINFAQILEELKDTARLQGNMLTGNQLAKAFEQWKLDKEQMTLIQDYFRSHHIGIDEPGDVEENLSGEDVSFLEMYLEELKALSPISDGQKRAVIMAAFAGNKDAQAKLIEIFLPQVVEISKLYAGQGALVEDLIGEGNVAAASAVTMLECVENIDEVEGFIGKMIMDAMEELINEDSNNHQFDENVLNQVNDVNDKAKELYDTLLRKVTVGEVAKELGVSEKEVLEAVKFSANRIDYIAL
ncbi:RNA polymerase sigma factor SigA [Lachnospiraceae bacterium]|nr:RNA polymerase sigma factor SigA [Lachnospiraceae bacterium]